MTHEPVVPLGRVWFMIDRDTRAVLVAAASVDIPSASPLYHDGTPFENLPPAAQRWIAAYLTHPTRAIRECYKS